MPDNSIRWYARYKVHPSKLPEFHHLAEKVTAISRGQPGVLEMRHFVEEPTGHVSVLQAFRDPMSCLSHMNDLSVQALMPQVQAISKVVRFEVYGTPNAPLRQALADWDPIYLKEGPGFSNVPLPTMTPSP